MNARSRQLRFSKRITSSTVPVLGRHRSVKVIQPDEKCCACCSDCATPDVHDDGGCVLPSHRVTDWTAQWSA